MGKKKGAEADGKEDKEASAGRTREQGSDSDCQQQSQLQLTPPNDALIQEALGGMIFLTESPSKSAPSEPMSPPAKGTTTSVQQPSAEEGKKTRSPKSPGKRGSRTSNASSPQRKKAKRQQPHKTATPPSSPSGTHSTVASPSSSAKSVGKSANEKRRARLSSSAASSPSRRKGASKQRPQPDALPLHAQELGQRLTQALKKTYYFYWSKYEHFYSTIDRALLKHSKLQELLDTYCPKLQGSAHPRPVWWYLRSKVAHQEHLRQHLRGHRSLNQHDHPLPSPAPRHPRRPRRFSQAFIRRERHLLHGQREYVHLLHQCIAETQIQICEREVIPPRVPLPLHVGDGVLVALEKGQVRPGKIVGIEQQNSQFFSIEVDGESREIIYAHAENIASFDHGMPVTRSQLHEYLASTFSFATQAMHTPVKGTQPSEEPTTSKNRGNTSRSIIPTPVMDSSREQQRAAHAAGEQLLRPERSNDELLSELRTFRSGRPIELTESTPEHIIDALLKDADSKLSLGATSKYATASLMMTYMKLLQVEDAIITAIKPLPSIILSQGEATKRQGAEMSSLRWSFAQLSKVQQRIKKLRDLLGLICLHGACSSSAASAPRSSSSLSSSSSSTVMVAKPSTTKARGAVVSSKKDDQFEGRHSIVATNPYFLAAQQLLASAAKRGFDFARISRADVLFPGFDVPAACFSRVHTLHYRALETAALISMEKMRLANNGKEEDADAASAPSSSNPDCKEMNATLFITTALLCAIQLSAEKQFRADEFSTLMGLFSLLVDKFISDAGLQEEIIVFMKALVTQGMARRYTKKLNSK